MHLLTLLDAGVNCRRKHTFHEYQVEPAAELESHLPKMTDTDESKVAVQADRDGIVGIDPGNHHMLAHGGGARQELDHEPSPDALPAAVGTHVHAVLRAVPVAGPCPKLTESDGSTAASASGIAGFGTFGEFRAWPGYRHSVEHSVHVRADCRGQGIGRALVLELLARAAGLGKHVMIAGIDADNVVSIGLHRSLGFTDAGHFHEVAFKFGRWLDLVFMQCILPPTVDSPPKE